ncbi:hypothetical protein CHS0354_015816 [Potamilus streckersoni]|uniref:Uncharacterized protein n=1 Tax=Potamilus streckersoni TaxID=2493646 RepID=A0AAE0SEF7_9BIVA|nr:hypothetical protein CHS0354_015816 [Potamilus streckersoni]
MDYEISEQRKNCDLTTDSRKMFYFPKYDYRLIYLKLLFLLQLHTSFAQVFSQPEFTKRPVSQRVTEGERAVFECLATGYPAPNMSWVKDFQKEILVTSLHYDVFDNGTLVIKAARVEDSGIYWCYAENIQAKIPAVATLSVTVLPNFVLVPVSQVVNLGDTVWLDCLAVGDPSPVQRWEKDGRYLLIENNMRLFYNYTLVIVSIKSSQLGEYVCKAHNEGGSKSVSAFIQTQDRPVFIVQPSNTTVNIGQTVQLLCTARAVQTPRITWLKLTVTELGKIWTDPTSDTNKGISMTDDGSLVIKSATSEDQGWYQCVATNDIGNATASAYVTIQGFPVITTIQSNRTEKIVSITCIIRGFPYPTLTYYAGGHLVTSDLQGHLVEGQTLIIAVDSVQQQQYTCWAENIYGSNAANFSIPGYMETPLVTNVTARSVDLKWLPPQILGGLELLGYVIRYCPVTRKDWTEVSLLGTKVTTTVHELNPFTAYQFQICARNALGRGNNSSATEFVLTLEDAPSPPQNISVHHVGNESLLLSWSPPSSLNGPKEHIEYRYKLSNINGKGLDEIIYNGTVPSNNSLQVELLHVRLGWTYIASVWSVNTAWNFSSQPASIYIDLNTTADINMDDTLSPDKIIIIIFGVLGGIVVVLVIMFIAKFIHHENTCDSLSFIHPRHTLDLFYMEDPNVEIQVTRF